ncbi:TIGR01777 family oxidoreductase [Leucobacter massiliensis]|uniref:TIGR01777 family protein n=1 Tax=Leucobacter massiliensis TaxID=1686285 RepID=A0A2S9QP92_9MICO|nr:TIGR01777 family oxidoreductase [Leucobacter massiliensis]PRI11407.1 TIGR01777 family protein [Leucobacter massiliensis]
MSAEDRNRDRRAEGPGDPPRRAPRVRHVVIAGGSGLIGGELTRALRAEGATVTQLVRRPPRTAEEAQWQPGARLDPALLAGADAVVGLNGASIARLPWTRGYRELLRESRIAPTRSLATALRELGADAPAFLSASAVGYYGDRPGEDLDETSGEGRTFLARLCADWEREALAAGPGCRVVLLRTAPLLHPRAVLRPLIALTRLGLGGPLGPGGQLWPWISLTDEVRAIRHLMDVAVAGPVNLTGPVPASATDIGRAVARQLRRPYLLPAPAPALRLALGRDAADALLLADARVRPAALTRSGFEFTHRTAEAAVAAALGGSRARTGR